MFVYRGVTNFPLVVQACVAQWHMNDAEPLEPSWQSTAM